MIAGRGEVSSVVLGAAVLAVVPTYIRSETYQNLQPVVFGALALWAATRGSGSHRFALLGAHIVGRLGRAARPPVLGTRSAELVPTPERSP
jgi:hypothetical protein